MCACRPVKTYKRRLFGTRKTFWFSIGNNLLLSLLLKKFHYIGIIVNISSVHVVNREKDFNVTLKFRVFYPI